ncbi:MAG: tetraacyldisaccharide 4'-kinase [Bacteroidota bacterium]
MKVFVSILLYPFSLIYGLVTFIRNVFFDWGILPSEKFDLPVISVGNLSMGGTGKTPHVEYLTDILKDQYTIGILSRGYRRKTSGFYLADEHSDAKTIGDEPMQFYKRYINDGVYIAVDENRVRGTKKLLESKPDIDVLILDDAFQHRWIKSGLNILLTDFFHPFYEDYVVPSGRLREFRFGAKRADIIVVSKSGKVLSPITRRTIEEKIKPRPHQSLYFSFIDYGEPRPLPGMESYPGWGKTYAILLVTGIANPYPLENKVAAECTELHKLQYPDHHKFSIDDAKKIRKTFEEIISQNKIIITTEKDAMRLSSKSILEILSDLPIFYWPIHVDLHSKDKEAFNSEILDYVRENKANR